MRLFFGTVIAVCLLVSGATLGYAQKSLDDDNGSKTEVKKDPKKKGGKDLDAVESKEKKSEKSSGGKSLDSVESNGSGGKSLDSGTPTTPPKKNRAEIVKRTPTRSENSERSSSRRDGDRRLEKSEKTDTAQVDDIIEDGDVGPDYPEMVTIDKGDFMMGSSDGGAYETPVHNVKISNFDMSKYEITNHQFRLFVKATSYKTVAERDGSKFTWRNYAIKGRSLFPVVMLTWEDTVKYCEWLSTVKNSNFRLPTEAEWEYAARGGNTATFPWGMNAEVTKANFSSDESRNSYAEPVLDFLKPVGSYEPNAYGIYDMIGNVWEWTYDWFNENYYKDSPSENPAGPESGRSKVIRGGGWGHQSRYCSVSFRKPCPPNYKSSSLGFRVLRSDRPLASNTTTATATTNSSTGGK